MTISRIKDKLEVVNFRGREDRMQAILKKRIRVYGIVQGVGFGPTVDRLAHEAGIEAQLQTAVLTSRLWQREVVSRLMPFF